MDKEKLTKHIKNHDDRQLVMHTLSKVESVLKSHRICYTNFYNPYEISLCVEVLDGILDIKYEVVGGYNEAERKVMIIYPEYMLLEEDDFPIKAIKIAGKFKENDVTHRDCLGAVLGLGLKREKIGDILVGDGQVNIIAFKELCEYIRLNLGKVSKYKVDVDDISFDEMIEVKEEFKRIHTTVSSLRLDTIVSSGFGESRSAIVRMINNDRVKVNFKSINQVSYILEQGDCISFRGKGRIVLEEIGSKTKKDRYKVVIKKLV